MKVLAISILTVRKVFFDQDDPHNLRPGQIPGGGKTLNHGRHPRRENVKTTFPRLGCDPNITEIINFPKVFKDKFQSKHLHRRLVLGLET